MKNNQAFPLPKVHGEWNEGGRYPEVIRVPMSDGKVIRYRLDIGQPHPQLLEAIENIRNMKTGYERKQTK